MTLRTVLILATTFMIVLVVMESVCIGQERHPLKDDLEFLPGTWEGKYTDSSSGTTVREMLEFSWSRANDYLKIESRSFVGGNLVDEGLGFLMYDGFSGKLRMYSMSFGVLHELEGKKSDDDLYEFELTTSNPDFPPTRVRMRVLNRDSIYFDYSIDANGTMQKVRETTYTRVK